MFAESIGQNENTTCGIGYARASTDDRTLNLQLDALNRAKCQQIYKEHASGKNAVRPRSSMPP